MCSAMCTQHMMWLGASQQVGRINISDISMLSTTIKVAESACDLGVILDAELTMSAQCLCHCTLSIRILSTQTVSSIRPVTHYRGCQDTCSGVYILPSGLLQFASVWSDRERHEESPVAADAAACLITGARRHDHITPMLCQLHWLPVRRRVEFKLTCLLRQALCGQMPT